MGSPGFFAARAQSQDITCRCSKASILMPCRWSSLTLQLERLMPWSLNELPTSILLTTVDQDMVSLSHNSRRYKTFYPVFFHTLILSEILGVVRVFYIPKFYPPRNRESKSIHLLQHLQNFAIRLMTLLTPSLRLTFLCPRLSSHSSILVYPTLGGGNSTNLVAIPSGFAAFTS